MGRLQNAVVATVTGPACHQARSSAYPNIIATICALGPAWPGRLYGFTVGCQIREGQGHQSRYQVTKERSRSPT